MSSADLQPSAPSPTHSTGSNPSGNKRKRDTHPPVIATNLLVPKFTGNQLLSQQKFAQQYLQSKNKEVSFQDILSYLSIQHNEQKVISQFKRILQSYDSKVTYNPRGLGGIGSYKYRSIIPVENADQLKGFLQRREDFTGLKFDDIKDGWPECAPAIDEMERKGELLVIRDRRKVIRTVWQDDPSLREKIGVDFKEAWHNIKLPANPDDLRAKLEEAGLKPTSALREGTKAMPPKQKKKRVPKRNGKETNAHINHLLKDFSHKRK